MRRCQEKFHKVSYIDVQAESKRCPSVSYKDSRQLTVLITTGKTLLLNETVRYTCVNHHN